MLLAFTCSLASCAPTPSPDPTPDPTPDTPPDDPTPDPPAIVVPEYKDYGRDTQDFDILALSYARPDTKALCDALGEISAAIRANEIEFDKQLEMITELEDEFTSYRTMYTLAELFTYKDSSAVLWSEEFAVLSAEAPKVSQATEDMYVAAAQSPHVDRFEEEYFGDDLYEEYHDGGIYTDEVVELMETEAEYTSEYNALSTATVEISFNGKTGTYDELVAELDPSSKTYEGMCALYGELYSMEYNRLSADIYVSLINVRREISDTLGYDNYLLLAYEDMGYDYAPEDMLRFLAQLNEFVLPVYLDLYSKEFSPYFNNHIPSSLTSKELVDSLYSVYCENNEEFADIYAYMLQHGLYDVAPKANNRYEGALTTYLHGNNSPYLFMSTGGSILDYSTMAHEFGHFIDGFTNWGASPSLELAEVSSQALEFLTLGMLEDSLTPNMHKYLKYTMLAGVFETLIYQGYYSLIEHYAYTLAPGEIRLEDLDILTVSAYEDIFGIEPAFGFADIIIPHLVVSPLYVQSYCTSIIPSVEIYLAECDNEGSGIEIYTALIDRGETSYTFVEYLECAGLGSPFDDGALKNIANRIYYHVYGKYYFKSATGGTNEV